MEEIIDFTRSRLTWANELTVGDLKVSCSQVIESLEPHLTDERKLRLKEVVERRSTHVISILENIYDRGNISAVMRSTEAFGFLTMHLVDPPGAKFKAANRVTKGADKWLDVHTSHSTPDTVLNLKKQGYQIWTTDLNATHTIDTLDWSKPLAIVLGNEKDGVSPEMSALADGSFQIPMMGFSQSFNISVAGALIFYRAHLELKKLGDKVELSPEEKQQILANYYLRSFDNPEALLRNKLSSK